MACFPYAVNSAAGAGWLHPLVRPSFGRGPGICPVRAIRSSTGSAGLPPRTNVAATAHCKQPQIYSQECIGVQCAGLRVLSIPSHFGRTSSISRASPESAAPIRTYQRLSNQTSTSAIARRR